MATDNKTNGKIVSPSVTDTLRANKMGTAASSIDTVSDNTNNIFRSTAVGSLTTAIGDNFYGINHRQTPSAIQINKDFFGLTFFTRPRLNLTSENIRSHRALSNLLSTNQNSLPRIIRCLLDPELARGDGIDTPLVDRQQAFIPVLTNNLLSMSGWPDVMSPTFTSPEGMYKEAFSFVDGVTDIYSTYDITANFRNIPGDPITALFLAWVQYASLVYRGIMVPYPDALINNEIDYNTRIYRLVLDSSKTKVQKIAACGASFPTSSPIGGAFNFEHDRPINSSNDTISIPFRCMGAMYQDDILISEFNKVVVLFNDGLKDDITKGANVDAIRNRAYKKVPIEALGIFNNRGYPRININTYELEWWVNIEEYNSLLPLLKEQRAISTQYTDINGQTQILKGV